MELICNEAQQSHLEAIRRKIKHADEVIISVAFLKLSGVKSLEKELSSRKCTFFVGTDYYLTEPKAIRTLLDQGHLVHMVPNSGATFHPKLYYFRKKNQVSIIIGSANFTGGGLTTNTEVSACFDTDKDSEIDKEILAIIADFKRQSILADEVLVSQYERKFEINKEKQKQAKKEVLKEVAELKELDFSKLDVYKDEYRENKGDENFKIKARQYVSARHELNRLLTLEIKSPTQFLNQYDKVLSLFYSSGLPRGKRKYSKKYKKIIEIVRLIKSNSKTEPEELFKKVLPILKDINGYGINALTEAMVVYNPQKYAVANGRSIASLGVLFRKFPNANKFSPEIYKEYCDLLSTIAARCKFTDLMQVDHFLSFYYAKHVKKLTGKELGRQL